MTRTPTTFGTDERATSPTVGAVLLVAVTVLLAAAVGSQLLGLVGSQQVAFATASVEHSPAEDRVTVTWLANGGAEELTVRIVVGDRRRAVSLDGVGDRVVVDEDGVTVNSGSLGHWHSPTLADGDRVTVTVVAVKGDESVVVAEKTATV